METLRSDLIGFGLYIGYFILVVLPLMLLKAYGRTSFEIARKLYHFMLAFSIFPLLTFFSDGYVAAVAALMLVLILYPALALLEHSSVYRRIAVERTGGEFKRSLIVAQLAVATLVLIFWGILGDDWRYIVIVAVMAWGFGDAAAALVGKAIGRHHFRHARIEGTKTVEGTLAMFVVAGLTILFTLLAYSEQPWYVSVAVAIVVAPVSAAVELFSHNGMDTLSVPLSVAFSVMLMVSFFSVVGG